MTETKIRKYWGIKMVLGFIALLLIFCVFSWSPLFQRIRSTELVLTSPGMLLNEIGPIVGADYMRNRGELVLASTTRLGTYSYPDMELINQVLIENTLVGLALSPNSSKIVTWDENGDWQFWDASLNREAYLPDIDLTDVVSIAWSSNGLQIAFVDISGIIHVISTDNTSAEIQLVGHSGHINGIAWSPDSEYIASWGDKSEVFIWNIANSGEPLILASSVEEIGGIRGPRFVNWSPDGNLLVAGDALGDAYIWETDDWLLEKKLNGERTSIYFGLWSDDGKYFVVGNVIGEFLVWETTDYRRLRSFNVNLNTLVNIIVLEDDQFLSVNSTGKILFWAANTYDYELNMNMASDVVDLMWSLDGSRLYSTSENGVVFAWDIESKNLKSSFFGELSAIKDKDKQPTTELTAYDVLFAPCHHHFIRGREDGTIYYMCGSASDGGVDIEYIGSHSSPVTIVSESIDGKWVASGSERGEIGIWSNEEKRIMLFLERHSSEITALVWHSSGQYLAAGYADGAIRIWKFDEVGSGFGD